VISRIDEAIATRTSEMRPARSRTTINACPLVDGQDHNSLNLGPHRMTPVVDRNLVNTDDSDVGQQDLRRRARRIVFFIVGSLVCAAGILALSVALAAPADADPLPNPQGLVGSSAPWTVPGELGRPSAPHVVQLPPVPATPAVPIPQVKLPPLPGIAPVVSILADDLPPLKAAQPLGEPSAPRNVASVALAPPSGQVSPFGPPASATPSPTQIVDHGDAKVVRGLVVATPPARAPNPESSFPLMAAPNVSDGASSGHGATPLELLPPPTLLVPVLVVGGVVAERTRARRLLSYPRLAPPG